MDAILKARELGKAIQEDARYKAYVKASEANEKDDALKANIEKFNELRMKINDEIQKPEKDEALLATLDNEIKTLYGEIMATPAMSAFNEAKQELDVLLNHINAIISGSCDGQNPDEIDEVAACSGSCSSCAGC